MDLGSVPWTTILGRELSRKS